jgi:excinuclease ABC subunit C
MLARAVDVEYLTVNSESEALFLEDNLIKKHQPEFNRLLKADNSYGYIKITNDPYPQVYFTRKRINDGAHYIGPKTFRQELKKLLQYLRQFLKWRGCKSTQFLA